MVRLFWPLVACLLLMLFLWAYTLLPTGEQPRPERNVYYPFTVELSVKDR